MSEFGTFSLADIAQQAQTAKLRSMQIGVLEQKQQADAQDAERTAMREQAQMIAKLTDGVTDDAGYQQRRQAALAYGMDPSAIPEAYDPQFVQTYNTLAHTLLKPDGEAKLTTTAQELVDAGYQPGTPEFIGKMRERLELADSKVVTTTGGGMASLLGYGGQTKPLILPNPGGQQPGAPAGGKTVVRTGRDASGRQVVQYSDGSVDYAGGAASNGGGNFP